MRLEIFYFDPVAERAGKRVPKSAIVISDTLPDIGDVVDMTGAGHPERMTVCDREYSIVKGRLQGAVTVR